MWLTKRVREGCEGCVHCARFLGAVCTCECELWLLAASDVVFSWCGDEVFYTIPGVDEFILSDC